MSKIGLFIRQSWLLIAASFCFGLLLAVANAAWAPRIEQNKVDKLNSLMSGLLPEAARFELADEFSVKSPKGKETRAAVYRGLSDDGQTVGYCFNASGPGFADNIELVVAVDGDFEHIAGFDVLSSNETPGFGDRIKQSYYRNQFKQAPAGRLKLVKSGEPEKIDDEIVAVSGATVSSEAVVATINNMLPQIKEHLEQKGLISGGSTK